VKLADLGLLKKERTDLAERSSKPGAGGSLRYQAPEWMTGSNAVTCISDVWSLGLTLIFCATGSLLLPTDYWGLVGVLRSTEPITLPANNGFSRDCNDFLQRCLVRDPNGRATVKELLQHPWVATPAVEPNATGANSVPLPMEPEMEERLARKDENDLKDLQVP
jgi:serine/threonine protein kinase